MTNRRAGTVSVRYNGQLLEVQGNVTFHDGSPMREAIVGFDGVHGYKETPKAPFVELEATWSPDLDLKALKSIDDATITVAFPNGQVGTLSSGWFAGEGEVSSEEGKIAVRFEGRSFDLD